MYHHLILGCRVLPKISFRLSMERKRRRRGLSRENSLKCISCLMQEWASQLRTTTSAHVDQSSEETTRPNPTSTEDEINQLAAAYPKSHQIRNLQQKNSRCTDQSLQPSKPPKPYYTPARFVPSNANWNPQLKKKTKMILIQQRFLCTLSKCIIERNR